MGERLVYLPIALRSWVRAAQ